MDTKVFRIKGKDENLTKEDLLNIKEAGAVIKEGGLVAFPTETVYGLGGDALNPNSSKKIYAAKGRPSDNPLIVHICNFEDIYKITSNVPENAKVLADAFWPGPLTMILNKSDIVPLETTGGLNTVAIRFPSHPVAQKLIEYSGGYIAAPSANLSGKPSPAKSKYVEEDMMGRIEVIIDGGEVDIGLESTIVDLTGEKPEILRPGFITKAMLEGVLGSVDTDVTILKADSKQAPKAPGMKYRHYAPKGDLTIVKGEERKVVEYINEEIKALKKEGKKTGIICTEETKMYLDADSVKCIGSKNDEQAVAHNLFNTLREFDDEGVEYIFSECFESKGLGAAIMNRLLKAAGHKVIEV